MGLRKWEEINSGKRAPHVQKVTGPREQGRLLCAVVLSQGVRCAGVGSWVGVGKRWD